MATSVILIAYHSDRWIATCVESLRNASSRRLHLVLVDNSGNTQLDKVDRDVFDLELIHTPNPLGFAEANNFALKHARRLGSHILFLNQDTISSTGWIDACLEAFEGDPAVGAISPVIRTYDGSGWDPSFLACIGPEKDWESTGIMLRPAAPAPALMVRRDVLERVGPFDPVFGSYYEDYDLCRRIRQAGYHIGFVRSAEISHFSGSSTDTAEKVRKRVRLLLRNRTIHRLRESKSPRARTLLHYATFDVPRRLLRAVLRTPSSQPVGAILQAQMDLLRLGPRLFSQSADEAAWKQYLKSLDWPEGIAGFRNGSAD